MMGFRVIVTTCLSGCVPSGIDMPRGHFTHVFVDEAGQASEPECLVPIANSLGNETNVILSGDPCQLGPIIHSPISVEFGLGVSFLERLMQSKMYDEHDQDGNTYVQFSDASRTRTDRLGTSASSSWLRISVLMPQYCSTRTNVSTSMIWRRAATRILMRSSDRLFSPIHAIRSSSTRSLGWTSERRTHLRSSTSMKCCRSRLMWNNSISLVQVRIMFLD
jgi:hypothetical protein